LQRRMQPVLFAALTCLRARAILHFGDKCPAAAP
jgi:hypothetical protein